MFKHPQVKLKIKEQCRHNNKNLIEKIENKFLEHH